MEEDDFLDRVDRYLMPETATGTAGVVGMGMVPILGDTIDAADVAYGIRNRDPARAGFGLLGLALGPLGGGAALRELFKRSKRGRKALEAPRQPLLLGSGPTSFELEREPGEMLLGLPGLWRSNALETIERAPRHSMTPSQWEAYLKKKPGGIKKIASHLQRLDAQNPNQKISRDELLDVTESQLAPERSVSRQVRSFDQGANIIYNTDATRGPLGVEVLQDIATQFERASVRPHHLEVQLTEGGDILESEVFNVPTHLAQNALSGDQGYEHIVRYIHDRMLEPDGLRAYPSRLMQNGIEVSDEALEEFDQIIKDIELSRQDGIDDLVDRMGKRPFTPGARDRYIAPEVDVQLDDRAWAEKEIKLQQGLEELVKSGAYADNVKKRVQRGREATSLTIENLFESGSPIQSLEDFVAKVNQRAGGNTPMKDVRFFIPDNYGFEFDGLKKIRISEEALLKLRRLLPVYGEDQYRFPEKSDGDFYQSRLFPKEELTQSLSPYEEIVYYLDPKEMRSKVAASSPHFEAVDNPMMSVRSSTRPFLTESGEYASADARKVYFVEEVQSDAHQRAARLKGDAKKKFGVEISGYSKAKSQLDDRDFKGVGDKLRNQAGDLRGVERDSFNAKRIVMMEALLRSLKYNDLEIEQFKKRSKQRNNYGETSEVEALSRMSGFSEYAHLINPEKVESKTEKLLHTLARGPSSKMLFSDVDSRKTALGALDAYEEEVKKIVRESPFIADEVKQDIDRKLDYFGTNIKEAGGLGAEMLADATGASEDVPFKKASEWGRLMIQDLLRKAAAEGAEGFTIITPDQLRLSMKIRPDFRNPTSSLHRRWKGNLNWYGEVLPNILKKEAKRLGLKTELGLPIDKRTGVPFDRNVTMAELKKMTEKQMDLSREENLIIILDDEARKKILSDIPSFKFGGLVN